MSKIQENKQQMRSNTRRDIMNLTNNETSSSISVVQVTNDITITSSASGTKYIFNDNDGATITLPVSTGGDIIGTIYTFIIGVTATSNTHKIVLPGDEKFYGTLITINESDTMKAFIALDGDGYNLISSNGTTTGTRSSEYTVINIGAGMWQVSGTLLITGDAETPFEE